MSNICSKDKNEKNRHNNNSHRYNEKEKLFKEYGLCGIKNYGTNCYLNSGLQIISRCEKFVEYLNGNDFPVENCPFYNILKKTINIILKYEYLDPKDFMNFFIEKNSDFTPNAQNCSQLFIRTVLSNINIEINKYFKDLKNNKNDNNIVQNINGYYPKNIEKNYYDNYLINNKIFPQSLPYSYFSGIIKTESTGNCKKCGDVTKYSFMEFFDQHMYLDTIKDSSTDFKNVLKENLGYPINIKSSCPKCTDKIDFKDNSKIIKLPEILVFTIERYIGETNTIPIKPNEIIDVKDYVETSMNFKNTKYELFAINIRFGYSNQFGHQICQIKKDNIWYTLNDNSSPSKSYLDDYKSKSYGLFYKLIKTDKIDYKETNNEKNQEITILLKYGDKEKKIEVKKNCLIEEFKKGNNMDLNSNLEYKGIKLDNSKTFEKYDVKNDDTLITNFDFEKNNQNINENNLLPKNQEQKSDKEIQNSSNTEEKKQENKVLEKTKEQVIDKEVNIKQNKEEDVKNVLKEKEGNLNISKEEGNIQKLEMDKNVNNIQKEGERKEKEEKLRKKEEENEVNKNPKEDEKIIKEEDNCKEEKKRKENLKDDRNGQLNIEEEKNIKIKEEDKNNLVNKK